MWALIIDGKVHETTAVDPDGRFHPSLQWVACDVTVEPGDSYDGAEFSHLPGRKRRWRNFSKTVAKTAKDVIGRALSR